LTRLSTSDRLQHIFTCCARGALAALLLTIAPEVARAVSLDAAVSAAAPSGTGCTFTSIGTTAAFGVCSDSIGSSSVSAFAQPGHIGGMATVTSADPFSGLPAMGSGSTSYFDTVVFKSSDPLAISTMVSMNLNVSGVVNSTPSGGASAALTMFVQSFTGD